MDSQNIRSFISEIIVGTWLSGTLSALCQRHSPEDCEAIFSNMRQNRVRIGSILLEDDYHLDTGKERPRYHARAHNARTCLTWRCSIELSVQLGVKSVPNEGLDDSGRSAPLRSSV